MFGGIMNGKSSLKKIALVISSFVGSGTRGQSWTNLLGETYLSGCHIVTASQLFVPIY